MVEKKCKYCAMMIPREASICPHCRKRQGLSLSSKIFVGLMVVILIAIISNALNSPSPPLKQSVVKEQPGEQFKKMTSVEHLSAAKTALATNYKPNRDIMKATWGQVSVAKDHLSAIILGSPEYPEAQKLMKEVQRREKEIPKVAVIVAQNIMRKQRKEFADRYERSLLNEGMDVHVSVSGKNDTTLRMKWVLMSRPLVYKIINDENNMSNLKRMGFERIVFTDGYDSTWSIDMKKL